MKRFLLFSGPDYYASGGWRDYIGDFETVAEAVTALKAMIGEEYNNWAHIVDTKTGAQIEGEAECDKPWEDGAEWEIPDSWATLDTP